MKAELGWGAPVDGVRRGIAQPEGPGTVVGGVRWLGGVPAPERTRRERTSAGERAGTTFVIGRAHGPRLLELLCAAG